MKCILPAIGVEMNFEARLRIEVEEEGMIKYVGGRKDPG